MLERSGEVGSLFFLRDRCREVDFLLNRGGRFHLFECKWTDHADAGDLQGMTYASKLLGEDAVRGRTLVCRTPRSHPLQGGGNAMGLGDLGDLAGPASA